VTSSAFKHYYCSVRRRRKKKDKEQVAVVSKYYEFLFATLAAGRLGIAVQL
jgi:hypothetical protein